MLSLHSLLLASIALSTVLAAPLTEPRRSFFTTSCNSTCGPDLSTQLIGQPTALDRFKLLNASTNNFIFNFLDDPAVPQGPDGKVPLASAATFPATIGNGVAMGVGFLGPCGLNVPHLHPRASEMLVALGGSLVFGTFQENGATFVTGTLNDHEGTVFPQGSIHFQQNLNCAPAQFVAAFGSEDPGRTDVAPAFFNELPSTIVNTTLGGIGVQEVAAIAAKIPANVAYGTQACLARCGLARPGAWTPGAVADAKRRFDAFMKQGVIRPADFQGLPVAK